MQLWMAMAWRLKCCILLGKWSKLWLACNILYQLDESSPDGAGSCGSTKLCGHAQSTSTGWQAQNQSHADINVWVLVKSYTPGTHITIAGQWIFPLLTIVWFVMYLQLLIHSCLSQCHTMLYAESWLAAPAVATVKHELCLFWALRSRRMSPEEDLQVPRRMVKHGGTSAKTSSSFGREVLTERSQCKSWWILQISS